MFIQRENLLENLKAGLNRSRCVAILGARQSGKSTLAKCFSKDFENVHFLDLEDPRDQARLQNPMLALSELEGLVIIDEIQRSPELFPILRVLLDRTPLPAKFLLLGSASPDLVRHSLETLAGRIEFLDIGGFNLQEVGDMKKLWLQGGMPPAYLAESPENSAVWCDNYIRTFLERDLQVLGFNLPPETMRRFILMTSHFHGQTWNASRIAASMDISSPTAKRYLDIMSGAYIIRQLQPWYENLGKRLVKSPKIYFRDSGIFHTLSGIRSFNQLSSSPLFGASWEGFAIEQIVSVYGSRNVFFWGTQAGAELDLLLLQSGKRIGFECKVTESPSTTKSMRSAGKDLNLDCLFIVYPGNRSFPIDQKIRALSLHDLTKQVAAITEAQ